MGSIMPISEMQSRLFFSALTNEINLPAAKKMEKDIKLKKKLMFERYVQSRRHTIQVKKLIF